MIIMKIKQLFQTLLVFAMSTFLFACGSQPAKDVQTGENGHTVSLKDSTIHVYYFHTNVRCETCLAVESHTRNLLKELFPKEIADGNIVYQVYNVEKPGPEDLIKKYKVWGQMLLFVKDTTVIDRTNDAFMNVLEEPEKWRAMVKEQVTELKNR